MIYYLFSPLRSAALACFHASNAAKTSSGFLTFGFSFSWHKVSSGPLWTSILQNFGEEHVMTILALEEWKIVKRNKGKWESDPKRLALQDSHRVFFMKTMAVSCVGTSSAHCMSPELGWAHGPTSKPRNAVLLPELAGEAWPEHWPPKSVLNECMHAANHHL